MKLKENQEKKMPHPGVEPELCEKQKLGVHGAEQFNANTSRPHCRRYQKCYNLYTVHVNRTSWLRQNNDERFCKITKICLLETK